MDADTLTELLSGKHLSMAERTARGVWPHPPLRFSEVVHHLARVIESCQWFPRPWAAARPGELVADVTVIERRAPNCYLVHGQRSGATGRTVAEQGSRTFESSDEAAEFYLRAEFNLPGDLDGWRVEMDDIYTRRGSRSAEP